jgi:hypothetical protein
MNALEKGVWGKERPAEKGFGRRQHDRRLEAGRKHPPSTWSICFRSYSFSNAVEERNTAKMGEDSSRAHNSLKWRTDLRVLGDFDNIPLTMTRVAKSWIFM